MKRRKLLGYAGAGLGATLGLKIGSAAQAQTPGVTIRSLGHTSFLFTGGGRRILANPFRRVGCTAGFPSPAVPADIVIISSRLFDEGYLNELEGEPRVLTDPGVYDFENLRLQGIVTPHDRQGGRRFGNNTVWRWTQGGVTIVHMGGAAAPLGVEEQILLGRPDIMLVPVGGGPKAYTAAEAVQAVQVLRPKIVVPTHYLTTAAGETCELDPVDDFLALMQGTPVTRATTGSLGIRPSDLPSQGMRIQVYQYPRA
ncbi:MAG: Zn-dependent hydrolase [Leptolyngbya sp. DLM2.Bin27]|nr:MAG: Zn-dependent hydrolase [Leptolyngbya sp. DLM2.Bin27]